MSFLLFFFITEPFEKNGPFVIKKKGIKVAFCVLTNNHLLSSYLFLWIIEFSLLITADCLCSGINIQFLKITFFIIIKVCCWERCLNKSETILRIRYFPPIYPLSSYLFTNWWQLYRCFYRECKAEFTLYHLGGTLFFSESPNRSSVKSHCVLLLSISYEDEVYNGFLQNNEQHNELSILSRIFNYNPKNY